MSREWKPGDMGVSANGERFIVNSRGACFWPGDSVGDWSDLSGTPCDSDRPLVVIDFEDREQVERLELLYLRDEHDDCDNTVECMQAALREFANPTPPKPDEPVGLGAVVEDSNGDLWVRHEPRIADFYWFNSADQTRSRAFRNIAAVRVLSEGVTP